MRARLAAAMFGEVGERVTIGRYEVLEALGAGGMGVVYAAWDDKLERRVAIKLMSADLAESERDRARLVREAQALAKLSHPNVVQVYEVGEHEGAVYLVMELVAGISLQQWQARERRPWWMLLDVYVQAGQGLAAAHQAGLVHRDFKPANVLVGDDGRVRVADFGLAHGPGLSSSASSNTPRPGPTRPRQPDPITRTGALVGTPAYMAPEQLRGAAPDARADQFSFCVALHEALLGPRPYPLEVLHAATDEHDPALARGSGRAPWWVMRALRRGLRLAPEQRWPSMDVLLDALARRKWRQRTLAAAASLAVATTSLAVLLDQPPVECSEPPHAPSSFWTQERKLALKDAMLATGQPYAHDVWQTVEQDVDAYARRWGQAYVAACRAGQSEHAERGPSVPPVLECLDRRAGTFSVVVERLSTATGGDIAGTEDVLALLEPVSTCNAALARDSPALPATPPSSLLEQLDVARAEAALGHLDRALEQTDELLASPRIRPYPGVWAEVLVVRGQIQRRKDAYAEAESTLADALRTAAGSQHADAEVQACRAMVELAAESLLDATKAEAWLVPYDAALERVGRPPLRRAELLAAQGLVASLRNDHQTAARHHGAALELFRTALGDEQHIEVTRAMVRLANAHADQGDLVRSSELYERVLDVRQRRLGEHHPEIAVVEFNLGLNALESQDVSAAIAHLERAHAIEVGAFGPESVAVAKTEVKLSEALLLDGSVSRARDMADHAWRVLERSLPRTHEDRLAALHQRINIELTAEQHAESLRLLRLLSEELPPGHDSRPRVFHDIAWLLCQTEGCEGARAWAERAQEALAATKDGPQSLLALYIELTFGLIARSEARHEAALAHVEKVLREAPAFLAALPEETQVLITDAEAFAATMRQER